MWWDWSTAGKKKNGKPYAKKGPYGKAEYATKKGNFRWEKNVVPEYFWFNGAISGVTAKDMIDPGKIVPVNQPLGSRSEKNARIFPFKVHRGKQPYDKVNKTLLIPRLFGKKDTGAYWANYDWQKALTVGMEYAGLPYSGQFDFVETTYVFPITHMVAPKNQTLACGKCHKRETGRLANLAGFYMPGWDRTALVDTFGWLLILGSLGGVMLHGLGRLFVRNKKEESSNESNQ